MLSGETPGEVHHDDAGVRMCVVCCCCVVLHHSFTRTHTYPITQPLRLEIKKKLTARSDRIKSVDLHPTEVRGEKEEGREGGKDRWAYTALSHALHSIKGWQKAS